MPSLRINPWESPETLIELGRLLYKEDGSIQPDTTLLQRGCDLADAYARRGPLPHAIASTTGLARAVLAERCLVSSSTGASPGLHASTASHAISALYAVAFAAFVTGYLDNKQTSAAKRTMYDLAAEIGMPPSFVARRHAIIHEGYAGLRELRRVAIDGLAWLWENYWIGILENEGGPEANDGEPDAVLDKDAEVVANKVLDEQVSAWAAQPPSSSSGRNEILPDEGRLEASVVVRTILQARGGRSTQRRCTAIVDRLLRDDGILASSPGTKGERSHIAKWHPLLCSLATQMKPRFTPALINGLFTRLFQPVLDESRLELRIKSSKKSKHNADHTGKPSESTVDTILAWARHFCNHPTWVRIMRAEVSLRELARSCLENPGPHATILAVVLVRSRLWIAMRQHKLDGKRTGRRVAGGTTAEVESLENLVEELTTVPNSTQTQKTTVMDSEMKIGSLDTIEVEEEGQEDMDLDQS